MRFSNEVSQNHFQMPVALYHAVKHNMFRPSSGLESFSDVCMKETVVYISSLRC
jgi:hypothetical protein